MLGRAYGSVTVTGVGGGWGQPAAQSASEGDAAAKRDGQLPATDGRRYGDLGANGSTPYPITVTLQGGYRLTAGLTITGTGRGQAIAGAGVPTWGGAFLGNRARSAYTGIAGSPALYQVANAEQTSTITLSNVRVVKNDGAQVNEFSIVVADAESTDPGESIVWRQTGGSGFSWLPNTPGATSKTGTTGNACAAPLLPAIGSKGANAECRGTSTSGGKSGTPMARVSPVGANALNIVTELRAVDGRQAAAFGILIARAQATVRVQDRIVGTDGTSLDRSSFGMTINGGSAASTGPIEKVANSGDTPVLVNDAGLGIEFAATRPSDAVAQSYAESWQCSKTDPGSATPTIWSGTAAPRPDDSFALLRAGQSIHCTVTFTPPYLTLVNQVVNGRTGASNVPADWTVSGTGTSSRASGSGATARTPVAVGMYMLSETGPMNPWIHGYRWTGLSCAANPGSTALGSLTTAPGSAAGTITSGSIPIAPGNDVTCRFVNTAQAQSTLTLVKRLGKLGTAKLGDFTLIANSTVSGALAGPRGTTGTASATAVVTPGVMYHLDERGPATYTQVGGWNCVNQRGGSVVLSGSAVAVPAGDQVTCSVTNATARLTLLKQVDGPWGILEPSDFELTASPAELVGRDDQLDDQVVVGNASAVLSGAGANTFDVRPGHEYTLSESSDFAHLGLSLQVYPDGYPAGGDFDDSRWQTVDSDTVRVTANQHAVYRFVSAAPAALALPLTGGVGSDTYVMAGGALLLLALAFLIFRSRRSAQREPGLTKSPTTKTPSIDLRFARIQKGFAAMATIKKSRAARIAAGLGAAAIATVTILGGALPASAAPNIDDNRSGEIWIHKYEQPVVDGSAGTGHELTPAPDAAPIDGVRFSVERVNELAVTDNATWSALRDGLSAEDIAEPAYTLSEVGVVETGTAGSGSARIAVPLGVYLVTELSAPASAGVVIPAKPFLVVVPQPDALTWSTTKGWLYSVHVYPKNTVTDVTKSVKVGLDAHQGLRAAITWTIDVGVPIAPKGESLATFTITDELNPALELAAAGAVRVAVGTTSLVQGTDFTVENVDGTVTIAFLERGMDALAATRGARVAIELDTVVRKLLDGTIENTAIVRVDGTAVTSNEAVDYWGSVEFRKVDDKGQVLAGAVFQVFDPTDMTTPISIDNKTTFTSDENGIVTISGLRTNAAGNLPYVVREIEAPAGYDLDTTEHRVEVPIGMTADYEHEDVVNAQIPGYALPVTGGSGQAAFMIGGAGLILGGLGFVLLRRRKARAAEQA